MANENGWKTLGKVPAHQLISKPTIEIGAMEYRYHPQFVQRQLMRYSGRRNLDNSVSP